MLKGNFDVYEFISRTEHRQGRKNYLELNIVRPALGKFYRTSIQSIIEGPASTRNIKTRVEQINEFSIHAVTSHRKFSRYFLACGLVSVSHFKWWFTFFK